MSEPSSRTRWLWRATAAVIVVVAGWHCFFSSYDYDEIHHLHAAWMVAQGAIPYADFLDQHHPLFWYLFAPLAGMMQDPGTLVLVARAFNLAGILGLFALVASIARKLFGPGVGFWPALLLAGSTLFVRKWIEVRPDPWMTLLFLCGLSLWLDCLRETSLRRSAAAGLFFGLSMAFLQKAALLVALVALAQALFVILARADRRRAGALLGNGMAMLVTAALPLAALFLAMSAQGIFGDFFFWNYTFNRFIFFEALLPDGFSALPVLMGSFRDSPMFWIMGVAGIAMTSWVCLPRRGGDAAVRDGRLLMVILVIGFVPSYLRNQLPNPHYLLPWFPLLAVTAAPVFQEVFRRRVGLLLKGATIIFVAITLGNLIFSPSNVEQRSIQDFLLKATSPDEAIFVPPPLHPIFRRFGAYFWSDGKLLGDAYDDYCRIHACAKDYREVERARWASDPPVLVLVSPWVITRPYRWEDHADAYEATGVENLFRLKRPDRP